jgi:hypothetical protein
LQRRRSVVPSDSETVPLPDHDPSKPANGAADWAWLADTESISAALKLAALIACPKRLEPNRFILRFPVKNDVLNQDTSRRIKVLVSPNYIRFKPSHGCWEQPLCNHCIGGLQNFAGSLVLATAFSKCQKKPQRIVNNFEK